MAMSQPCAVWGCNNSATYEHPLCYEHWTAWQSWEFEECVRCHWVYDSEDLDTAEGLMWDALPELRRKNVKLIPATIQRSFLDITTSVPSTKEISFCPRCVLDMLHAVGASPSMPPALLEGMRGLPLTEERPAPPARKQLERVVRYVYVLKNNDGSYYVGQTNDLPVRLQQHRDGQQRQTRGKAPRLVYFEQFVGERETVDSREQDLQRLNRSTYGQRRLTQLVERWRTLWRLLDLEA